MQPYYTDGSVTLHHGDMREVIPALSLTADLVLADPPYGETNLEWDRWPGRWLDIAATAASSLWCFGSMRMFFDRLSEFAAWKLSQDIVGYDEDGDPVYRDVSIVWEKGAGSGISTDRLRRVHEHALHWYRGAWADVHHIIPRVAATPAQMARNGSRPIHRAGKPEHLGAIGRDVSWQDDGTRQVRSVIRTASMRGKAIHPTEKPVGLLDPLIRYACPPGGTVLDPFAGSGSTAVAARLSGRRAVLIEADERYCERIAQRLQQDVLPFADAAGQGNTS